MNRRAFVSTGAVTGAGTLLSVKRVSSDVSRKVRLGCIGVGSRGTSLLRNALRLDGVEIAAVCDIQSDRAARAQRLVE